MTLGTIDNFLIVSFYTSTRVIKPNGPDIGRKVKVRATGRTAPSSSNSRHRDSTSIPTSGSQSGLSSSYKSANASRSRNRAEKKIPDIMRRPLKWVLKLESLSLIPVCIPRNIFIWKKAKSQTNKIIWRT